MSTLDPREARLPRWAQEELRAARNRADRAEQALADYTATLEKTQLWHGDYTQQIYMPISDIVVWGFGTESVQDQISVHRYRNGLTISGGGPIVVAPTASNSIDVRLRRITEA